MKKILTLLVLVSSLFALAACQSAISNTKVRVVGLSYSSSETTLATIPSNNSMRLLSNKLLADEVEEYIFPGDILTFTVELEDPNFELVALLAIKFNGQVIRANVDNSIVTTRDCGANICVDFPYEITAETSEYAVQEVKFAKTNIDGGVNAIIDNQSAITLVLDVYTDEILPYVLESVQTLNNAIQNMKFYHDWDTVTSEEHNNVISDMSSRNLFYISGFGNNITEKSTIIDVSGIYDSQEFYELNNGDIWNFNLDRGESGINATSTLQYIHIYQGTNTFDIDRFAYTIKFLYFEQKYNQIFFFNVGNQIYVNILGAEHFVLEIKNGMKVNSYEGN